MKAKATRTKARRPVPRAPRSRRVPPPALINVDPRSEGRTELRILTPDGLALRFELAPVGSRLGAFLVDLLLILGLAGAILLVGASLVALDLGVGEYILAANQLVLFLLFFFYFNYFEVVGNGATFGKRRFKIVVVDARGEPLDNAALFTRNITRQFELVLPLAVLMNPGGAFAQLPSWGVLAASLWLFALLFLPAGTPTRQRAGDFLAGTLVVERPTPRLESDLVVATPVEVESDELAFRFEFTNSELDLYGIFELQKLEDLLRGSRADRAALRRIRDAIEKKMGRARRAGDRDDRRFLEDLYPQLRRRLENKLRIGERQERKRRGTLEGGGDGSTDSERPRSE